MRMGQGVRTGLGDGGITCVLQTQFSSFQSHAIFNDSQSVHIAHLMWTLWLSLKITPQFAVQQCLTQI